MPNLSIFGLTFVVFVFFIPLFCVLFNHRCCVFVNKPVIFYYYSYYYYYYYYDYYDYYYLDTTFLETIKRMKIYTTRNICTKHQAIQQILCTGVRIRNKMSVQKRTYKNSIAQKFKVYKSATRA